MAILEDQEFLERIQFFNGQRLLAEDLQTLESFDREMRWLHNFSLHQPGIGSGYAVSGKKGASQVVISPGYALDALGREIILTQPRTEQVPPVADNGSGKPALYDLLVAYPPDENLTPSETRSAICFPSGAVRLHEEPVFCWARLTDDGKSPVDPRLKQLVGQQMMIVLARASIFNCQLKEDISVAVRRNVRPARLPKVACGVARLSAKDIVSRDTFDIPNPDGSVGTETVQRYSFKIDTSSGAFASTPSYFMRLRSDDSQQLSRIAFSSILNIVNETPKNFEVQLIHAPHPGLQVAARSFAKTVIPIIAAVWMGVEV